MNAPSCSLEGMGGRGGVGMAPPRQERSPKIPEMALKAPRPKSTKNEDRITCVGAAPFECPVVLGRFEAQPWRVEVTPWV